MTIRRRTSVRAASASSLGPPILAEAHPPRSAPPSRAPTSCNLHAIQAGEARPALAMRGPSTPCSRGRGRRSSRRPTGSRARGTATGRWGVDVQRAERFSTASSRRTERQASKARRAVRARHRHAQGGPGKKVVTTSVRREVVSFVKSRGYSERRACALIGLQRSTCQYRHRRVDDEVLVGRLRELASELTCDGVPLVHEPAKRRAHERARRITELPLRSSQRCPASPPASLLLHSLMQTAPP
jgi:hypothetical protein